MLYNQIKNNVHKSIQFYDNKSIEIKSMVPRQFRATNSAHNSAPTFQRIQIQRRDNSAH